MGSNRIRPMSTAAPPDFIPRRDDTRYHATRHWALATAPHGDCEPQARDPGEPGRLVLFAISGWVAAVIWQSRPQALDVVRPFSPEGLLAVPRWLYHQPGLVLAWRGVAIAGT
ncbi:hypothetical protein LY78DRAFT_485999 [Colletotrichum sublineola]|nr:hypothetical protein LY78DRAFT_485999 [Colletotrichum sublineola]